MGSPRLNIRAGILRRHCVTAVSLALGCVPLATSAIQIEVVDPWHAFSSSVECPKAVAWLDELSAYWSENTSPIEGLDESFVGYSRSLKASDGAIQRGAELFRLLMPPGTIGREQGTLRVLLLNVDDLSAELREGDAYALPVDIGIDGMSAHMVISESGQEKWTCNFRLGDYGRGYRDTGQRTVTAASTVGAAQSIELDSFGSAALRNQLLRVIGVPVIVREGDEVCQRVSTVISEFISSQKLEHPQVALRQIEFQLAKLAFGDIACEVRKRYPDIENPTLLAYYLALDFLGKANPEFDYNRLLYGELIGVLRELESGPDPERRQELLRYLRLFIELRRILIAEEEQSLADTTKASALEDRPVNAAPSKDARDQ